MLMGFLLFIVLFCIAFAISCLVTLCKSDDESNVTPTPSPELHTVRVTTSQQQRQQPSQVQPSAPPSPELQTARVTASQRRQQPSQIHPSAPPMVALKEERERLVNECFFSRKLEEGDSVAFIESILAAAQDHHTQTIRDDISSRSTKAHSKSECSICLDGYKTGETICWSKMNECDHIFHQDCIVEWMVDNDVCPLCRLNLMSFHHSP